MPPDASSNSPTSKQFYAGKRTALREWRRMDLDPVEKAKKDGVKSMSSLVQKVATAYRFDRRQDEAEIAKVWAHLVDPSVAAHAMPVALAKGTLIVKVDSSVWLDEIVRYRRREILQRLQHAYGKDLIKKISYSV